MKLRNKILVYTLPLILIPLVGLALANYYFVIRANRVQAQEEKTRTINQVLVSIRQEIETSRRDVKLLSKSPAVVDFLEAVKQKQSNNLTLKNAATNVIQLFFDQNPYYFSISIVDTHGTETIKFSRRADGKKLEQVRQKEYFQRTLMFDSVRLPALQHPIKDNTSKFATNIVKNRFIGMIVLSLNTKVFETAMKPLNNRKATPFIFDDRGIVVAGAFEEKDTQRKLRSISNEVANQESFSANESKVLLNGGIALISTRPAYFFPRNETYKPRDGEKWFLGIVDYGDRNTPFLFQGLFLLVLLIAIIAMFFVASRVAKRVTIPLEKVSFATAKIARGEMDLDLQVKTGDEIEDLANAVAQMNSDLKDYQKKLVHSTKLATIGEMASEISHEIQNRISGLSLWLQCLDGDTITDEQRRQYVGEMKEGLGGFMAMLATLKEYYKTPALKLESVDLNSLVTDALPFVSEEIDEKNISIVKSFSEKQPMIMGDKEKLKSVILNLLLNAIDAVEEGGEIEITTESVKTFDGDQFALAVRDDGKGITNDDLSRIFVPFYSTKAGGSGLGLAICSNILSAHKGEIKVESEIGSGSEFTIVLPIS